MDRRTYLAVVGAGVLPGCVAGGDETEPNSDADIDPDPESQADFEITAVDFPDEVESGLSWSWSVTVANVDDVAGTYVDHLFLVLPSDKTEHVVEINLELDPGETATYGDETVPRSHLATYEYRFMDADRTIDVAVVPASLAVGEPYRTPEGIVLTVEALRLQDAYTYENFAGNERTATADDGYQWAFVDVTAANDARRYADHVEGRKYSRSLPRREEITLRAGEREWTHESITEKAGGYTFDTVHDGAERDGWIAYEVPADLDASDLRVRYAARDQYGEWAASWRPDDS